MSTATMFIVATIAVYLCGMLYIGYKCADKNETTSDFFLGGRTLGPYVTAMSAEASDMSSYLLMGLPGLAYLSGIADVGWTCIGLATGTYLNWLFTARKLRRYTHALGAYTLPQYLSLRFGDKRYILSLIAAIIIIIFFIPYTASGFAACGKLFSSLFGIDYMTAMIVSAIVIVGYTATGGFLAASFTDFIQSIIMTIALLGILLYGISVAGGMSAVMANAASLAGYLSFTESYVAQTQTATPYGFLTIISTLAWGFGYFGMPHILLRFMAINDAEKLKVSRRVASVWVVCAMFIAIMIGIVGLSLSRAGAVPMLTGSATETIIIKISDLLASTGALGAIMAGIVLSGILASTMSTADSQLLAAASSVSQNIIVEFMGYKITKDAGIRIARLTVVVIAILGVILAQDPSSSIFGIVSFAWAGFGAGFGPVVICSLFWRRTNFAGALAGMVSGGVMIFVWKYMLKPLGGVWGIYELLPAFLVSLIAIIIVSLMTAEPDAEIIATYDKVNSSAAIED